MWVVQPNASREEKAPVLICDLAHMLEKVDNQHEGEEKLQGEGGRKGGERGRRRDIYNRDWSTIDLAVCIIPK